MQVAPRRLWGWEPQSTTEYFYDAGVLIRSVTTTEPEWDTEQIDLLLASKAFDVDLGAHGQLRSEATNPAADPNEYGPYRYVSRGPFTDWAEKARLDAVDEYKKQFTGDAHPNLNGMFWVVEKKDN